MLSSKRSTLSEISVDNARGILVDRLKEAQEEQKRNEERIQFKKRLFDKKIVIDDYEEVTE